MTTNDTQRHKAIDSLRTQLHRVAACPPNADPFSREGREAWQNWTEICRGYESELREAGVDF